MHIETSFNHGSMKYRIYTRKMNDGKYVTNVHRTNLDTHHSMLLDNTISDNKMQAKEYHAQMLKILI